MADFESVADELYSGDIAGFVAARDTKAREAKAAGDAALAKRIRELRKPTVAAAIVNELARGSSDVLADLLQLGEQWRRAEDGLDVRALIRRRRELVNKALRGLPKTSETVAREVEETLEAVVADPDAAREAEAGRLSTALRPSAESDSSWLSIAKPPPELKPEPASSTNKEEAARKRRHDKAVREAAKLAEARDKAQAALEKAAATARDLRAQAVKAEKAAKKAERAEETAHDALEKATSALERAEEQLE